MGPSLHPAASVSSCRSTSIILVERMEKCHISRHHGQAGWVKGRDERGGPRRHHLCCHADNTTAGPPIPSNGVDDDGHLLNAKRDQNGDHAQSSMATKAAKAAEADLRHRVVASGPNPGDKTHMRSAPRALVADAMVLTARSWSPRPLTTGKTIRI